MNRVAIYPGIIEAVWSVIGGVVQPTVPPFGNASQYAYDVRVNYPDGSRLHLKMKPVEERYADGINVIPLQTGRVVQIGVVGGELQLLASEKLHVVPCGGGP